METGLSQNLLDEKKKQLYSEFVFREIRKEEAPWTVRLEAETFPPHEACPAEMMIPRTETAPNLCLVAEEKSTGTLVGMITGLATFETAFRDEFFENAALHNPEGTTIMILGVEVMEEYRRRGLACELMALYQRKAKAEGRQRMILTCADDKVAMYEAWGFEENGTAASNWGGESWHEMIYRVR